LRGVAIAEPRETGVTNRWFFHCTSVEVLTCVQCRP
jgi:hypothetical protein